MVAKNINAQQAKQAIVCRCLPTALPPEDWILAAAWGLRMGHLEKGRFPKETPTPMIVEMEGFRFRTASGEKVVGISHCRITEIVIFHTMRPMPVWPSQNEVLSPIESLLDIVHSTAIQIFEAVEQMAIYFVKESSQTCGCQCVLQKGTPQHGWVFLGNPCHTKKGTLKTRRTKS